MTAPFGSGQSLGGSSPRRGEPKQARRAAFHLHLSMGALTLAAFVAGGIGALRGGFVLLACVAFALGACVLVVWYLHRRTSHPLRTAASVLDALRHGDYTHRARVDVVDGPVSELLTEINQLAGHLQAERGRAEEASALLEALVERVDVAVLAFDDASVLRWWNPAAERLFHTKLHAGTVARELGAEELLEGPTERSVVLSGSAEPCAWELRRGAFHRGGKRYQFLLLASAQRVRREEERAAWQRLVRVLGHEVNNTLAPIQSLSTTCRSMLAEEGSSAIGQVMSALEVMERRSASLGGFISEFARLARLPEPRLEPLELGAHVRQVVMLDTRCPVHVVGKQSVEILADGALLEQALLNLIRNAIDASLVLNGAVTIDWHADADSAVLSIIDEGPGVSNPDNLFVPLFSTKPQGSGIGLVLSRNIVEAHGGQLRLDNRLRAPGCVARITLPRTPPAGAPPPGPRTSGARAGHPHTRGA
jgi:two-component system, NtrC family, nitrogen regulation sensor histidine kinase NtrY